MDVVDSIQLAHRVLVDNPVITTPYLTRDRQTTIGKLVVKFIKLDEIVSAVFAETQADVA